MTEHRSLNPSYADLLRAGRDLADRDLAHQINWMSREKIVRILEDEAGIQCYDYEPTEDLVEALRANISDGTIRAEMIDTLREEEE